MKSSTTASGSFARKDGARVKLYSRPGNDLTNRFSLIVEALSRLRSLIGSGELEEILPLGCDKIVTA
jgi:hypothetical protein